MAKQSKQDRLKRLSEGRCPIHGICMSGIDIEYLLMPCGHFETGRHIVKCGRKDCDIKGYAESPDKITLFDEFKYFLNYQLN